MSYGMTKIQNPETILSGSENVEQREHRHCWWKCEWLSHSALEAVRLFPWYSLSSK